MRYKLFLIAVFILYNYSLFSQKILPVIKANSKSVDIRDGDKLNKNAWNISPEIKPDIYTTSNKKVTFYTDIDSITFFIKHKKVYDFIILLNNKDTALTQIKFGKDKSTPAYLDILKKADKYDYSDRREIPEFTYQSMDNPNLVELRKKYNLDSIAGSGNDVLKILNLLHWTHNLIPHDGNHENPSVKNAINMISICAQDKLGLNCRGLATVLNECYLSLGFPSRIVTCIPKDSVFDDCHVINMVFSKELKKWLWIDPTNDAYIMNEKGKLLSIEEVRERLINKKPLILNPDANWNNKFSVVKEDYLDVYMAKNLYRMECPLVSEYNMETKEKDKKITYVELLPVDAFNQTPQKEEKYYQKSGVTYINYKTNNPGLFWTIPK